MDTMTRMYEGLMAGDPTSIAVAGFAVLGTLALYIATRGMRKAKAKHS